MSGRLWVGSGITADFPGDSLHTDGVHVFPEYSRAVRTMGRLADYADALAIALRLSHRRHFAA